MIWMSVLHHLSIRLVRTRLAQRVETGRVQGTMPKRNSDIEILERRREQLLQRLENLDPSVKSRPGYRSALRLLNQKFRAATLTARLGILEAAAFMVNVLENLPLV
jgi:HAMP domain-containing protein